MRFALAPGERILRIERGSFGNAALNWMFGIFSFGVAEIGRRWTWLIVTDRRVVRRTLAFDWGGWSVRFEEIDGIAGADTRQTRVGRPTAVQLRLSGTVDGVTRTFSHGPVKSADWDALVSLINERRAAVGG